MTETTEKSVGWFYAAWNDSEIWDGPHETRALAIQAAINDNPEWDQVSVCECFTDALRLADWIGLDDILNDAEERILDSYRINTEFEEGPFFVCSAEEEEDLKSRIRLAISEWQAGHGLEFKCRTFSDMRHMEEVDIRRGMPA